MQEDRAFVLWGAIELDSSMLKFGDERTVSDQKVVVQIAGDTIYFQIPVPSGATIRAALAQLGKPGRNAVVLTRGGITQFAESDTTLTDGDHLWLLPCEFE